jgi:hypothetical protein
MISRTELRLSAQRAFLGRIHPGMRLVKIQAEGAEIRVCVTLDSEPADSVREDVSEAAAEIISDFPEATRIIELFEVQTGPIVTENVIAAGWIYRRAE